MWEERDSGKKKTKWAKVKYSKTIPASDAAYLVGLELLCVLQSPSKKSNVEWNHKDTLKISKSRWTKWHTYEWINLCTNTLTLTLKFT